MLVVRHFVRKLYLQSEWKLLIRRKVIVIFYSPLTEKPISIQHFLSHQKKVVPFQSNFKSQMFNQITTSCFKEQFYYFQLGCFTYRIQVLSILLLSLMSCFYIHCCNCYFLYSGKILKTVNIEKTLIFDMVVGYILSQIFDVHNNLLNTYK